VKKTAKNSKKQNLFVKIVKPKMI